MEISLKSLALYGAVVLTGLSAGLFYAWAVSVIPGTKRIADPTYLETMQSINRAILNPRFFLIFFGSALFLGLSSILEYQTSKLVFGLMAGSTLVYLLGTIGITVSGNVPLNDQLDAMDLAEFSKEQLTAFRTEYETKWNRYHSYRTVFSVLSFILATLALLVRIPKL
jgi:uncharacterized membrane protein